MENRFCVHQARIHVRTARKELLRRLLLCVLPLHGDLYSGTAASIYNTSCGTLIQFENGVIVGTSLTSSVLKMGMV